MQTTLSGLATDTDFSLYLETASGHRFTYSRGASTMTTSYESASTSKWVSATIILRAVDQGYLSLTSRPQDFIDGWDVAPSDPLYNMTLTNLLSFTSGLTDEPACLNSGSADFETCAKSIATLNHETGRRPGAAFYYSSCHLQVAGLMAIKASGAHDWQTLFTSFRAQTGLFPNGRYDLPSSSNPRLAGGMHWIGSEYVDFVRALDGGALLSVSLKDQMYADQIASARIASSPVLSATGEDWHYGFGSWLECPSAVFNCDPVSYHSSPGAYGAYPFVNVTDHFLGIVARQGALGTFANGKVVFDSVRPRAEAWARCPNE